MCLTKKYWYFYVLRAVTLQYECMVANAWHVRSHTRRAKLTKVDHLFSFFLYRAAAHAI